MKKGIYFPAILIILFAVFISCTVEEDTTTGDNTVIPSTYTVTYDGNGNSEGTVPVDNTDYEQGDVVTVPDNTGNLRREPDTGIFYRFDGWNTAPDGEGTDLPSGATFTMGDADVILYAKWESYVPF